MPRPASLSTTRSNRPIDSATRQWLVRQILASVPLAQTLRRMRRRGFGAAPSRQAVARILAHPVVREARALCRQYTKLGSLCAALTELTRQAAPRRVPILDRPRAAEFFADYYAANRPVVLRGVTANWPALERWTPESLAQRFGRHRVEISTHRVLAAPGDLAEERSRVRLDEFVGWLRQRGPTNDYYLTARNDLLSRREFAPLLRDIKCPRGLLTPKRLRSGVRLWLGPAGTITRWHHDETSNFLVQIYGRKRVKLISPFELPNIYNTFHCYSALDAEQIDLHRFPLMKHVPILDLVLQPGDMLFLPLGWWHWVKALDVSISLSCHNLATPRMVVWDFRRHALS